MKASRTPSRDGAGITLAKRSGPGKHFRIGTLAWSGEHKELAYLTAAEFTRSIDLAESYAMRVRNRRSAIRGAPSSGKLQEALQGVLGPSWVLLAPWHAPTWPRIGRTGAGNVWPVRGKPPFFGRLVADRLGFDDGTSPPVAVVHANTFLAGQPGSPHPTETVSTLAFSTFAPNPVQPLEPVATGGPPGASVPIVAWRYAEFELPYASGSARKDHPITAEQLWQEALKITLPGHDQPADVHDPDDPQLDLDPLPDMKSDARS